MQFVVDGERTPGIDLVERLLTTGERYSGELTSEDASAALEALEHLDLPWLLDEMVESGEMLAEQIHSQASRGLQEVVQNAQDQRARSVRFGVRRRARGRDLLIAHDGNPVEIHDVVSMAYPLLSGSRADPEKIGRFGVGLKTLNQLGDFLDVHCPPLPGFEIRGARIRRIAAARAIRDFWNPAARETLFVLRLKDKRFDVSFFREWLDGWDSSSLVFLSHLHDMRLVDLDTHRTLVEHRLVTKRRDVVTLELQQPVEAERVELRDGRSARAWTRYTVRYPKPQSLKATHKALAEAVSLGIAVPHRAEPSRVYAGLPLEERCELPFSVNAPFDLNVDRTQIRDHNQLNGWLFDRLGDLATAICLQRFAERPKSGWKTVPRSDEQAGVQGSWLREQSEQVTARIRERVVRKLRIRLQVGIEVPLKEVVFEHELLDGLLTESDVERLHLETFRPARGARRAVPRPWRDSGRWRDVLADLPGPVCLDVGDALGILTWPDDEIAERGEAWLLRLLRAGLDAGEHHRLWVRRCVLLADTAERLSPDEIVESGTLLVHALPADGLAATLGMGRAIARPYRGRTADAKAVREWLMGRGVLRERPSDTDALRALARGTGQSPVDLSRRNSVLQGVRNTLEQVPAEERDTVAIGVGRNITLAGYEYEGGERRPRPVRPADAYLPSAIDKNEGWPSAASQTPKLRWIDRRYAEVLKTTRDTRGQGALAFLRALGASTAPRLVRAPDPSSDPYAKLNLQHMSAQHREEFAELPRATGLADDWLSPDLDLVIADMLRRKNAVERRRRARALFLCIDRAWNDRREYYASRAAAEAVHHYYTWHADGAVSATWVARLASEPWMSTRERAFKPKPPRELTVLTEASYEIEGENPAGYASELEPEDAESPVVEALGIQGRPWASTIVERLEELREADGAGDEVHQAYIGRCYRALASYCEGGAYAERSNLRARQLQARFAAPRGSGLIRWNGKWLPPAAVRRGPYLAPTFPWVADSHALWETLGVRESDIEDCVSILIGLASEPVPDVAVEINVFRRLLELLPHERRLREKLRAMPVRTYTGWIAKPAGRVYAIPNPAIAADIGQRWPVWRTPLPFDELAPLAKLVGITVLDDKDFEPDIPAHLGSETDVQHDFPSAVGHLKDYLLLNHPDLHDSVPGATWEELAAARVVLGSGWSVRVRAPRRRAATVAVRAYLFRNPALFCAADEEEAAAHDAGGQAIASFVLGNGTQAQTRSVISLAWEIAFRKRGEQREGVWIDLPAESEPESSSLAPLRSRRRTTLRGRGRLARPSGKRASPNEPPRQLVTLSGLDLSKVKATFLEPKRRGTLRVAPTTVVKEPRTLEGNGLRGGDRGAPAAGARGYTDPQREDTAYQIIEAILRDTRNVTLEDVRDQPSVGADAIDRAKDIWVELKTHGREPDDAVRLEPSEALRAREKRGNYWLVIAWNLEAPRTPEFVVIPDPLYRLDAYLGRGLKLTGVQELMRLHRTT